MEALAGIPDAAEAYALSSVHMPANEGGLAAKCVVYVSFRD